MIGAFGAIDARIVRADVTFDDLDLGPADSIDELDFILRLESLLGGELSNGERAQLPSPDGTPRLKVASFVKAVCTAADARAKQSESEQRE